MELIVLLLLVAVFFLTEKWVYNRFWHKNLKYECRFSRDEVYEGDEIELIETVTNAKLLPLTWAKAEITASRWLAFAGSQSAVTGDSRFVPSFFVLKSNHRVTRRWKVRCLRRGNYTIDRITLITTDLFGQQAFSLPVDINIHLTVLPKPRDTEESLFSQNGLSGEVVVPRRLFTDPFFVNGVREYTPYDSANRIHWAATAKNDRIMVRSNDSTSDQTVTVLMNMQSRADEGPFITAAEDLEHGISAAATVITQTTSIGISTRLVANGGQEGDSPLFTGAGAGEEYALELLRVLAGMHINKSENFVTFSEQVMSRDRTSDLILITPYLDADLIAFARRTQDSGVFVKLLLTRTMDAEMIPDDLPAAFFLLGEDAEAFKEGIA
jgi:uncharacterized protein (DUF58 family)